MKKIYFSLLTVLFLGLNLNAQSVADCAIPLTASVTVSPPQIALTWSTNAATTQYQVYRKPKTWNFWGGPVATLNGTVTSYVDNTVLVGESYEYKVRRIASGYSGYGFINSGIQVPVVENRGNLILLVDSTFVTSLNTELKRLEDDLEGDGWNVKRINVLRTGSVYNVKAKVSNVYNQDPANTISLFIFGHVPVPYSGDINPDGHPDHLGAWPTDMYYADIDGLWSDVSVNSTTASPARTQNVPGDGKFDPSICPSSLEMQYGRVDLFDMTTFTLTETQLMQNYLNKDHDYRKKVFTVANKGVADINFGFMLGEAFGASGYNNMSVICGTNNVIDGDYLTDMTNTQYKWSYGCGGGSFNSCGGVGVTSNFASSNLQGIFSMLFGSYFGDWDVTNSFLKAPLAQGKILTCSWSGRPHHQYHWMALGETAGYSMKTTIDYQSTLYFPNYYGITANWVHNGLMGDPSLRNDVVAPVSSVVATKSGNDCVITWAATTETNIVGYNIYMKNDTNTNYVKVNANPISALSYTDNCLLHPGIYKYMVRVLKLENTPSGTYYNMSEGIADTALNLNNLVVNAQYSQVVNSNTVSFTNQSSNATAYSWTLNTGATSTSLNPSYTYTANGTFTVTLIASNACDADTFQTTVTITVIGLDEKTKSDNTLVLYPNPASLKLTLTCEKCDGSSYIIYNTEGRKVVEGKVEQKEQNLDIHNLPKGLYLLKLQKDGKREDVKRFVIE